MSDYFRLFLCTFNHEEINRESWSQWNENARINERSSIMREELYIGMQRDTRDECPCVATDLWPYRRARPWMLPGWRYRSKIRRRRRRRTSSTIGPGHTIIMINYRSVIQRLRPWNARRIEFPSRVSFSLRVRFQSYFSYTYGMNKSNYICDPTYLAGYSCRGKKHCRQ